MNMKQPIPEGMKEMSGLSELLWNWTKSMDAEGVTGTALFAIILILGLFVEKQKDADKSRIFLVVSFMMAGVWLLGESFSIDDTLHTLYYSWGQISKSVVYLIGMTFGLTCLTHLLYWFFNRGQMPEEGSNGAEGGSKVVARVRSFYQNHPFASVFLLLDLLWLPHIMIAYPAYFCYDSYSQLAQFLGMRDFTTHHPPMSTLLMSGVIRVGSLVSGNFGLFLFILLQMLVCAAVHGYLFVLLREMRVPIWLQRLTLANCVFVPYYCAYIGVFLKDNLYTYAVVLFSIELIYILKERGGFLTEKSHCVLWILSVTGVILLRNNGKYMIYPTLLILGIFLLVRWRRGAIGERPSWKKAVRVVCLLLAPVLLAQGILSFTIRNYGIEKGSIREALSLPMQQIARYVSCHGDEVTEEEKRAIAAVLDYDRLAEIYDPEISDPVKDTFNNDASQEDVIRFLRVWVSCFFKHPLTYICATVNQNYFLLYPKKGNTTLYSSLDARYYQQKEIWKKLHIRASHGMDAVKRRAADYYRLCFRLPVLNLLAHPAFYTILLIWLLLFGLTDRKWSFLMAIVPSVLSTGIVVLSPVIQGHPRYMFPVIYVMPLLVGFYLSVSQKKIG